MLKKLALGGAVIVAAAGLGLATPAQAETPYPRDNNVNVASQNGNVIVCGNSAIGDIVVTLISLAPVTVADRQPVDCSVRSYQNN
ncbi:hypothetical protein [Streptosporangium sp. KLBMP 9127]|nr:hypothetical protein [Streptosporangium sp. KLBMP 9127]